MSAISSPSLSQQMARFIGAAFPCLWVQTHEPTEAFREIVQLAQAQEPKWNLASWDIDRGLNMNGRNQESDGNPVTPLKAFSRLNPAAGSTTLLILPGYHMHLRNNPEVLTTLLNLLTIGKTKRLFVVILAPSTEMPLELERRAVVVHHPLPDRAQLMDIATHTASGDELPQDGAMEDLINASVGLTREEAEAAYALCLVDEGKLNETTVQGLRIDSIEKGGLLKVYAGEEGFASLGGLEPIKDFCVKLLSPAKNRKKARHAEARPRGIGVLGVPGVGKSQLAKTLGHETGRITVQLDVGALMGSLVGQSEANLRDALGRIDAIGPCVLYIDEVEKMLAGAGSANSGDSGVTRRLFGTFLTWLNDHVSDVFVVCTANDISSLPKEFFRSERFDAVWFIDLPNKATRDMIWTMYLKKFDLNPKSKRPDDNGWTGAEIRSCCRLAAAMETDVIEASSLVVPVAITAAEQVQALRQWAANRVLDADHGGKYTADRAVELPEVAGISGGRREVLRGK